MLPHHLHKPVTLEALAAKKHVLLEKPMAPNLVEAGEILAAAAESDCVFMMAENSQYWPEGELMCSPFVPPCPPQHTHHVTIATTTCISTLHPLCSGPRVLAPAAHVDPAGAALTAQ